MPYSGDDSYYENVDVTGKAPQDVSLIDRFFDLDLEGERSGEQDRGEYSLFGGLKFGDDEILTKTDKNEGKPTSETIGQKIKRWLSEFWEWLKSIKWSAGMVPGGGWFLSAGGLTYSHGNANTKPNTQDNGASAGIPMMLPIIFLAGLVLFLAMR